ncbi:MAG: DUF1638 domain-containing protein [Firmicutes bacterium]|nr:DUF1638 domain-containing protein [Bacillota bacterium]
MSESVIILACSSLKDYIEEAQKKLGTEIRVVYLDRYYHRDPEEMREQIRSALADLPEDVDTVLVTMGFCGGSWEGVSCTKRLVIPKIDDCVSLILQTGDEPISDLKTPGHFYVREKDPKRDSIKRIFENLTTDIDEETKAVYLRDWQELFSGIDIIDAGFNDTRRQEYYDSVKEDAEWLEAELNYVRGGTHLIEKLIKGDWDEQFTVLEPRTPVTKDQVLIQK